MTSKPYFYGEGVRENRGGLWGIALLAIFLCLSFFLATAAYGMFDAEGEGGTLSDAVAVLRELVTENEAVAVFLGFSDSENDSIAVGGKLEEDEAYREAILRAAEEYIKAHES